MTETHAAAPATGLVVHDHGPVVLSTREDALAAAHELAAAWSVAGPERDADLAVPHAELTLLGRSGLLGMVTPARYGGPGLTTRTLTDVFSILAAADLSLAQVPQNHFGTVYSLPLIDEERRAFWYAETLRGARFGNANAETGRSSRSNPATRLRDVGPADLSPPADAQPRFVLSGTKRFATGAMTADWITVGLAHEAGWRATAMVPTGTAGVEAAVDWDAFGQRSTHSGSISFTDVPLHQAQVIDHRGHSRESAAFRYSRSQLTHCALQIGAAEGALALAAEWPGPGREEWRAGTILEVAAARALVGRAADLIDTLADLQDRGLPLDAGEVMHLGVAVDEAKVIAYELGPRATDDLVRIAPADQATERIDRHWRNARVHALHDPVRWRRHYVGAYHLRGEFLPHAQWLHTSATTPS